MYQRFGAINRTFFCGPVLWLADRQALPPKGWCVRCGAEVYRAGREMCTRCTKTRKE